MRSHGAVLATWTSVRRLPLQASRLRNRILDTGQLSPRSLDARRSSLDCDGASQTHPSGQTDEPYLSPIRRRSAQMTPVQLGGFKILRDARDPCRPQRWQDALQTRTVLSAVLCCRCRCLDVPSYGATSAGACLIRRGTKVPIRHGSSWPGPSHIISAGTCRRHDLRPSLLGGCVVHGRAGRGISKHIIVFSFG